MSVPFDVTSFVMTCVNGSGENYAAGELRKAGQILVAVLADAAPGETFPASYHSPYLRVKKDLLSEFAQGDLVLWDEVHPVAMSWDRGGIIHAGIALADAAVSAEWLDMALMVYIEHLS